MQTTPSRVAPVSMIVRMPTMQWLMVALVMIEPSAARLCAMVLKLIFEGGRLRRSVKMGVFSR